MANPSDVNLPAISGSHSGYRMSALMDAVNLLRSSRPKSNEAIPFVKEWVEWGAGPRATQHLILAAKARAIMQGRYVASVEDVKGVVRSIMRHTIITNFKAQAEGTTSLDVIDQLLKEVKP